MPNYRVVKGFSSVHWRLKPLRALPITAFACAIALVSLAGMVLVPANADGIEILRGAGVATGVLLLCGYHLWPGIAIGIVASRCLLAGLGYWDLSAASDLVGVLVLAAAVTVQALAGAWCIRRVCGFPLKLRGWRQLVFLVCVVVPAISLIVATVGVALYTLHHNLPRSELVFHWLVWWVGDLLAINLAVATAVLGPWNETPGVYWRGVSLPQFNIPSLFYVTLSVSVTLAAWAYISRLAHQTNLTQFATLVNDNEESLKHRLSVIELAVDGGKGLFSASENVTAEDWRRYVEALGLTKGAFGIQSLGFVQPVEPDDVDAFLAQARIDGAEDLEIHPKGTTDTMFVIKYIEPAEGNRTALGLNIAFEGERYRAAITARDTGQTVITAPLNLVQSTDSRQGFLMLTPLYAGDVEPQTTEQRRAAFQGWVYSAFNAVNVLSTLTQSQNEDVLVTAYDGLTMLPKHLFYDASEAEAGGRDTPKFSQKSVLSFYGRKWSLVWNSSPSFEAKLWNLKPSGFLIGGLSFSVLLAAFLISIARREELVRQTVVQRTRELATQVDENRSIIETAVAKIALLDSSGRVMRANDAFARILGLEPQDLIGRSFPSLLGGQLTEYFESSAHVETIPPYRSELRARSSDGQTLILDVQVIPWTNGESERRFTAVMRNTSRYHLAAERLRNTQRRLELALTAARIGVFDIDLRTGHSVVSRTWRELMDLAEDDEVNAQKRWLQRVHPDDLPRVKEADRACIEGHTARSVSEYRVRSKDNSWRWMRSDMTGEDRDAEGRAWRLIGLMSDITDQHHVDELKKQFVATVSHELRTPLTSINGSISLLLNAMSEGLPDHAKRMLSIAQKNCDRLILLVNDILDLEKLETGIVKPTLAQADISAQVARAIQVNQPFADRFDVRYELTQDVENVRVLIEENRFQQVMSNLLSNAAKFSPKGRKVTISIEQIDAQVAVSVTDTGEGIPPESHDRIFKPFSQVDGTSTRKVEGSGLGLHIAKRTIEQMDGTIGFDSVPNVSTTFWIMLPIWTDAGGTSESRKAVLPLATLSSEPLRVLHVESDSDVAEVMSLAFLPSIALVHADSVERALDLMGKERFSMVILGGDLEGICSESLLASISSRDVSVPIVALTSADTRQDDPRLRLSFVKSRVTLDDVVQQCMRIIAEEHRTALIES